MEVYHQIRIPYIDFVHIGVICELIEQSTANRLVRVVEIAIVVGYVGNLRMIVQFNCVVVIATELILSYDERVVRIDSGLSKSLNNLRVIGVERRWRISISELTIFRAVLMVCPNLIACLVDFVLLLNDFGNIILWLLEVCECLVDLLLNINLRLLLYYLLSNEVATNSTGCRSCYERQHSY